MRCRMSFSAPTIIESTPPAMIIRRHDSTGSSRGPEQRLHERRVGKQQLQDHRGPEADEHPAVRERPHRQA